MDYEKKYKDALEKARKLCTYPTTNFQSDLEDIFPELKESDDEKIRKALIETLKYDAAEKCLNSFGINKFAAIAWLEKQGKNNACKFTFEDVLALECSMKTVKTIKGGDELYKILVLLYNKIHDAYLIEKQGEQMKTPEESLGIASDKCDDIVDRYLFIPSNGKTAMEAIKEERKKNYD